MLINLEKNDSDADDDDDSSISGGGDNGSDAEEHNNRANVVGNKHDNIDTDMEDKKQAIEDKIKPGLILAKPFVHVGVAKNDLQLFN